MIFLLIIMARKKLRPPGEFRPEFWPLFGKGKKKKYPGKNTVARDARLAVGLHPREVEPQV